MQKKAEYNTFNRYSLFLYVTSVLLLIYLSISSSHADKLRFTHFLTEDSRDTNNIANVTSIVQDSKGFIWFGGGNGLAKFDGHSFKFYQHIDSDPTSLSDNFVRDLLVDRDGNMWVATANGLNRYDSVNDSFASYHSSSKLVGGDNIFTIVEDHRGSLIVGTNEGISIINENRSTATHYTHDPNDPSSLSKKDAEALFIDSRNRIWVGTNLGGLNLFNPITKSFFRYKHDKNNPKSLSSDSVRTIAEDHLGRLWVGTNGGGLNRLNEDNLTFTHFRHNANESSSLASDSIWDILLTTENELWVAVDKGGIGIFQSDEKGFVRHKHNPYNPFSLNNNRVKALYEDRNGDIWVANTPGINYYNRSASVFDNFHHIPNIPTSLPHNTISYIFIDSDEDVWIGTEGGLSRFNSETRQFKRFLKKEGNRNSLAENSVLAIEEDYLGNIWIGTWSDGLHRYNKKDNTIVRHHFDSNNINKYIWAVYEDSNKNIWIGTEREGLTRYNQKNKEYKYFKHVPGNPRSLSNNFVVSILEDSDNMLWVGTHQGLNILDIKKNTFTSFFYEESNGDHLLDLRVFSLFEDSKQDIWIGTSKGLNKYDKKKNTFLTLTTKHGLPSESISSIQEDNQGFIWVSTLHGLAKINPQTLEIRRYFRSHGLASNGYNRNASAKNNTGELYFGGFNGLSIFHPQDIPLNTEPPAIFITDFKIFNRAPQIGGIDSPLKKHISETQNIILHHKQTMLSFEFAAMTIRSPDLNQYAYKLDGLDSNWHYVNNTNSATYTNLTPGKYVFQVKAANSDGVWNDNGPYVNITIAPPIWLTHYAFFLYLSLFLGLCWFVFRFQIRRIDLEKERKVVSQLVQLDKMKDEFLSNTSHELRTPLNGILGLTDSILKNNGSTLPEDIVGQLEVISHSGHRLSSLINDIIDFSKLANNQLHLNLEQVHLQELVEQCFNEAKEKISGRNLIFENHISPGKRLFADAYRLKQIIANLLDNAIKFTNEGQISIHLSSDFNSDTITITDTGIGISKEGIDSIFESFQQLEKSATKTRNGAGLGLSISKKLVELHHGRIWAESVLNKGSSFSFSIPHYETAPLQLKKMKGSKSTGEKPGFDAIQSKKSLHPDNSSKAKSIYEDSKIFYNTGEIIYLGNLYSSLEKAPRILSSPITYKILVVDDDFGNRLVVSAHLEKKNFKIVEAEDGKQALEALSKHADIALIILDVMMPNMTGYEVSHEIRKTYSISELPIIYLTANHEAQEHSKGFFSGGNDFLTKPVSGSTLLDRVEVHLALREENHLLELKRSGDINISYNTELLNAVKFSKDIFSPSSRMRLDSAIQKIFEKLFDTLPAINNIAYWQLNPVFELENKFLLGESHYGLNLVDTISRQEAISIKSLLTQNKNCSFVIISGESLENRGLLKKNIESQQVFACAFIEESEIFSLATISTQHIEGFSNQHINYVKQFSLHVSIAIRKSLLLSPS